MKHEVGTIHKLKKDLKDFHGLQILNVPAGTVVKITQVHGMGLRSVLPVEWKDWAVELAHGRHPVTYVSNLEPVEENPVSVRRLPTGGYRVRTPGGIKAYRTTRSKALAQSRLLRARENPSDEEMGIIKLPNGYEFHWMKQKGTGQRGEVYGMLIDPRGITVKDSDGWWRSPSPEDAADQAYRIMVGKPRTRMGINPVALHLPVVLLRPDGRREDALFEGYGSGIKEGKISDDVPWFSYKLPDGTYTTGHLRAGWKLMSRIPPKGGNPVLGSRVTRQWSEMRPRMAPYVERGGRPVLVPYVGKDQTPPLYKLCYLEANGKCIKPLFPIQVIPSQSSDIHFKFWGSSNYDRHEAFAVLGEHVIPDDKWKIECIEYEIIVDGKRHPLKHDFKCQVCFTQHGIRGDKVIMKAYGNNLEGLPKLPHDWQYFQFIG